MNIFQKEVLAKQNMIGGIKLDSDMEYDYTDVSNESNVIMIFLILFWHLEVNLKHELILKLVSVLLLAFKHVNTNPSYT